MNPHWINNAKKTHVGYNFDYYILLSLFTRGVELASSKSIIKVRVIKEYNKTSQHDLTFQEQGMGMKGATVDESCDINTSNQNY